MHSNSSMRAYIHTAYLLVSKWSDYWYAPLRNKKLRKWMSNKIIVCKFCKQPSYWCCCSIFTCYYYFPSKGRKQKLTSKWKRTHMKISILLRLLLWLCERHCKKGMKLRFNLYSFVSTSVLPLHVLSTCIHVCKEEPNTKHVFELNVSAF